VVCFDYVERSAWVFGKSINVEKEVHVKGAHGCGWLGWDGSKYWKKVSCLLGWSQVLAPIPAPTAINTFNFPQVAPTCSSDPQRNYSNGYMSFI
jgi:hypothetical protein